MRNLLEVCCGIDVHKEILVACMLKDGIEEEPEPIIKEFSTLLSGLDEFKSWLIERNCHDVAMESTGVYWFPIYNVLESRLFVRQGRNLGRRIARALIQRRWSSSRSASLASATFAFAASAISFALPAFMSSRKGDSRSKVTRIVYAPMPAFAMRKATRSSISGEMPLAFASSIHASR